MKYTLILAIAIIALVSCKHQIPTGVEDVLVSAKDNKVVIFMGGQNNPYDYKLDNKKAKVYRKTFGQQKNSLSMTAPDYEKLPGWLRSSHYIDVTKDYIPVTDIKLQLQREKPDSVNYAYLYVFNSGDWKAYIGVKLKTTQLLLQIWDKVLHICQAILRMEKIFLLAINLS